jgi:hypothetical protein
MTDRREEEIKTIAFGRKELDPDEEAAYKEKIAAAKLKGVNALKGSTPIGHMERPQMPDLLKGAAGGAAAIPGLTPEGGVAPRPPGSPVLSHQTAEQLAAMQKAQVKASTEEAKIDEEAVKTEVEDEVKEGILDLFDYRGQGEAERILLNKKRRKDIESRCEPMSFEDLLMKDEVQQVVPIIPGKFEPRFRSTSPDESLFLKQFMAKEEERSPSDGYAAEKFALCQLAIALVSINNEEFPDHRNKNGDPDEALFKVKLKKLRKKSGYIIADLGINYMWFDIRVRKLIAPDVLGNS